MELYQLRTFAAVAETGHLTRAAEKLHLSQPAVSAQIKALEDELGVTLFERGSGGMTLTAAGRHLLPEAEKTVMAAQSLRSEALALHGQVSGHIRLGTVADPEILRLPRVLARAVEKFPLLEIEVHHEISGAAFEKVRDGALDASFYFGALTHPNVIELVLGETAYRVVTPASWRDRIATASWEEIASEPWIVTPAISTHSALAGELFRTRGLSPARRVEADNEFVISSLVKAGVGISLMREDLALAQERAGALCIYGDARLPTTLAFIHARVRDGDPALRAVVDVVRDVWELPAAGRVDPRMAAPAPAGA
jgi:DNA-binding transcriptional LysR family regulator